MKKDKKYKVVIEGIATVVVRAPTMLEAHYLAFEKLSVGDFEIVDSTAHLREETETG